MAIPCIQDLLTLQREYAIHYRIHLPGLCGKSNQVNRFANLFSGSAAGKERQADY
jgi:hypothetical protein